MVKLRREQWVVVVRRNDATTVQDNTMEKVLKLTMVAVTENGKAGENASEATAVAASNG